MKWVIIFVMEKIDKKDRLFIVDTLNETFQNTSRELMENQNLGEMERKQLEIKKQKAKELIEKLKPY